MPPKKLGHYEIVDQLGAGGMGEVYRAKDTKLGRDVAIKILPEAFASDEDRRARFDREARLLASLNHPNIGTIYGLEESEGTHFLVLELVEGEDLTEHINRGPIPLDDALAIAKQVAIALEAAHSQDIVHRDLKPGNIRITPEGTVKVLDFGLAKAVEGEPGDSRISQSPTALTGSPTMQGMILGTAAYMSPEQARGKPVDKRADNWAFGCVLYEMLTGDMIFSGETVTDTLAKILERDPQWDMLPATTPPHVRRVLRRCLTKDPRERLHDVADARIELEGPIEEQAQTAAAPLAEQRTRPIRTIIAVTAIAAVVFGFALAQLLDSDAPAPEQKVRKFVTAVPGETARNGVLAISPNGMTVAYSDAPEDGGQHHLVVHPLEQLAGQSNLAVQGLANPAFSPDGDWIVYATASEVWRVPASGGDPRRIADARAYESFHWWRTDEIVMSYVTEENVRSIARLPASGGAPEVIISPRDSLDEWEYGNPFVLPEGRGILFNAYGQQRRSIWVWDAESGERKELIHDNSWAPRYTPTGHLTFVAWDGGSIDAMRFDLDALEVSGTPVTVADARVWESQYGISDDGVLVYLPQDIEFEGNRIMRVAPDGEVTGILETGGPWRNPSLSGDGRFLLMREVKANCVVWLYDIERESMSRLTFDGDCHNPTFSPDSRHVIYSLEDAAARHNHVVPIDGSAEPRPVGKPGVDLHPRSWSRDGKWVACSQAGQRTNIDIYLQNMETGDPQEPWLQTRFDEQDPAISPDGRWMAYTSNETGANEVYVRPFDGLSSRYVVSVGGGGLARWSPDGRQLYYVSGEALYRTTVETQDEDFRASRPEKMFEDIALLDRDYAVQPDGSVIVIGHTGVGRRSGELVLVLGFFEELKKLVPETP